MHGREVGGAEGIVNGMDVTDWNPAVDKFLDVKFDTSTLEDGKALAKETLQAELGLDVSNAILSASCPVAYSKMELLHCMQSEEQCCWVLPVHDPASQSTGETGTLAVSKRLEQQEYSNLCSYLGFHGALVGDFWTMLMWQGDVNNCSR